MNSLGPAIAQSDDVVHLDQLITRATPEDQTRIGSAFDTVKALRAHLNASDRAVQIHFDYGPYNREEWLRKFRTVTLNFGRNAGNTAMAQLLCHKKTLVLDCAGAAGSFTSLRPGYITGRTPDEALYTGLREATVVYNRNVFEEELKSNRFTSAIVFGTQSLSNGVVDPEGLLELIGQHLQGDLPRIFIIY